MKLLLSSVSFYLSLNKFKVDHTYIFAFYQAQKYRHLVLQSHLAMYLVAL
jgi:hypothetical protein